MSDKRVPSFFVKSDLRVGTKASRHGGRVEFEGKETFLTDQRMRIFLVLLGNHPDPVHRKDILHAAWGAVSELNENVFDKSIPQLNKKLSELGLAIKNEPAIGYRFVRIHGLVDAVDEPSTMALSRAFGNDNTEATQTRVTGTPKDGFRREVHDEPTPPESLSAPALTYPVDFTVGSIHSAGFCISFDSSMINHVWELLGNQGSLDGIIRSCYQTYRTCLEAFAFAIVYSSKIATGKKFRQSFGARPEDNRVKFLEGLGKLWMYQELPEDARGGALLEKEEWCSQIKRDMASVSRCVELESWPFRDWMRYEAYRHLGTHESLMDDNLPLQEYRFDIDRPYYEHADIQGALGTLAARQLSQFLREGIASDGQRYSERALQHFVSLNFLTNITVMREYEVGCNGQGLYRLSHAMRSLILGETTYDQRTMQQRLLRNLVVQHTLFTAFKSVHSISRQSLITVLLDLREDPYFRKMREILEHDHLILFHPSEESERKAKRRILQIWECADPHFKVAETHDVDGYRIMRGIGKSEARLYEAELYRVFPELRPTLLA